MDESGHYENDVCQPLYQTFIKVTRYTCVYVFIIYIGTASIYFDKVEQKKI